jgi:hypothetical protein
MNAKVQFDKIKKTGYHKANSVLEVQSASTENKPKDELREELKSLVALEALFFSSAK